MKNTKYGQVFTKEEKRQDIIKGIRKYIEVGMYDAVVLREKVLMNEYGMTAQEIEDAIYAQENRRGAAEPPRKGQSYDKERFFERNGRVH